ncbi:MAG: hypothetical protein LRY35_01265 [Clostridiales bacterium]|nr:hypothetical protein [Clostridiales bacterium]
MKIRKILTLALAMMLVLGLVAGCAQSSATTTAAAGETTTAAAETTTAAAPAEKIKVGVIYISPKMTVAGPRPTRTALPLP